MRAAQIDSIAYVHTLKELAIPVANQGQTRPGTLSLLDTCSCTDLNWDRLEARRYHQGQRQPDD